MYIKYYDVKTHRFQTGEFTLDDGKFHIVPVQKEIMPQYYISPGWIDMHTHIFDGVGTYGIEADRVGYHSGTCMVVDAGTIGEHTIKGFRKYVMPTIRTHFKIFLCISPVGVIFNYEYNALESIDVERTVKAVEENRDIVSGIKVRMGSEVIRHEGLAPLKMASDVAKRVNLPLMVHIGGTPPAIEDVEPFMKRGDILTHCFNGRSAGLWNEDGTPSVTMNKLIDKGVRLDIGHGAGSFNFNVFERAIQHDIPKFTCGTDLHANGVRMYSFDLSTMLTKVWGSGVSLEDTIWGVTTGPAEILGLDNWGTLDGDIQNATIFEVFDNDKRVYYDCNKNARSYHKGIRAVANILNGDMITVMPNNPFADYLNK